ARHFRRRPRCPSDRRYRPARPHRVPRRRRRRHPDRRCRPRR
ncbi:hypothetical protein NJB1907E78_16230, partial [Mycobacterium marinum]